MKSFSPFNLFKSLSKDDALGYISARILSRYMNRELGITTDREETQKFLRSLGIDKMSYKDFLTFLTPTQTLKVKKRVLAQS